MINVAATSLCLAVAGYWTLGTAPWYFLPLGWLAVGSAIHSLDNLGQDCIKRRWTPGYRWAQDVVGQIALLPSLRPFASLQLPRAPNGCSVDAKFLTEKFSDQAKTCNSLLRRMLRSVSPWQLRKATAAWCDGSDTWRGHGYLVSFFVVVVAAACLFVLLPYFTGLWGLVKFWLLPFLDFHRRRGTFFPSPQQWPISDTTWPSRALLFCFPMLSNNTMLSKISEGKTQVMSRINNLATAPAIAKSSTVRPKVRWGFASYLLAVHIASAYGIFLLCSQLRDHIYSALLGVALYVVGTMSITAGSHRLWAHKSYEATTPLQLLLMLGTCISNQGSIFSWSQDHRVHHRHTDTPADPHDASRGFWFSHMGWLLYEADPRVEEATKRVNMRDLEANKIVMFQHRHYLLLALPLCFGVPALLGWLWGDVWGAVCIAGFLRYTATLHATWLVNSAAHAWGTRPYLPTILSAENWVVSIFAAGEGWHNYHHAYPFDYSASEYGFQRNPTTGFLDACAALGFITRRRRAPIDRKVPIDDDHPIEVVPREDFEARVASGEQLLLIDGFVYDVAPFLDCHPGGAAVLNAYRGKDASKAFNSINGHGNGHSNVAQAMLDMYRVGRLEQC